MTKNREMREEFLPYALEKLGEAYPDATDGELYDAIIESQEVNPRTHGYSLNEAGKRLGWKYGKRRHEWDWWRTRLIWVFGIIILIEIWIILGPK